MSRNVSLVSQDINDMFGRMEPRHVALLVAKILSPDTSLIELSKQLWPDLGYARRKEILSDAQITKVVGLIRQKPWVMSAIMAGKLAPVMVATLFELSQNADKDNVRVTAAKELVRLAQSTAHQIAVGEEMDLATDALDSELASASAEREEEAILLDEVAEDNDPDQLFET